MGALDGRVCIITGAGRGIGREYARLFAAEGAHVVVDNRCAPELAGGPEDTAAAVVDEIRAAGGSAVASHADVTSMAGAEALFGLALDTWGEVHAVVNNAGGSRDKMLAAMSEDDWDSVIDANLKTTFCLNRVACGHWRDRSKAGASLDARIVNTTSVSGLLGTPGQTNYGAAKAGVAALTVILALEAERYGVRVNAICPAARTRMTESSPGSAELVRAPEQGFDVFAPHHPAPVAAYLASAACSLTGRVFMAKGGDIRPIAPWQRMPWIATDRDLSVAEVAAFMRDVPDVPVSP